MTRQWLAHPEFMCTSHISGEHAEAHSFLSKMRKGFSLEGFYEGAMFFGAEYIQTRHDLLATYLTGHSTPLYMEEELYDKYPLLAPTLDHVRTSITTLINRCEYCRFKHRNFMKQ